MKKIFTLTIVSLALILTIVNSCSKSSDTTTTTPTPVVTTVDTNTVIVDGTVPLTIACLPPQCNIAPSSNIFTMFMVSNAGDKEFTITTLPIPSASGTYTTDFSSVGTPYPPTHLQIKYTDKTTTPSSTYTALSGGTANVTVANGLVKVSFSKLTFTKVSSVVLSGTVVCQ